MTTEKASRLNDIDDELVQMCDEQTGPADEEISAAAGRSTQPTAAGTNHP
jgi:hypothetical protein